MEGPLTSSTAEALAARIGTEIGVSRWIRIDQTTIDTFANLTLDTYFIHTNPERAKQETPFGGAISHGFLTLSMLSTMATGDHTLNGRLACSSSAAGTFCLSYGTLARSP